MLNEPPNDDFQFDDFYYKPSPRRPIIHLHQLQRKVTSILIDYEDFGTQENQEEIRDYFQFNVFTNHIGRNIDKPSVWTVYHLYIYDRGTANSRNSAGGMCLTSHILHCSSVLDVGQARVALDEGSLKLSFLAYQQCVEWIRESEVLAHLSEDLIEYLKPYVETKHPLLLAISVDKHEDGIITFRKAHPTLKKNEAMKILNKLMAKGPVDFTAFWSDLIYNFRFSEEAILVPVFYKEFSDKQPKHNFCLDKETGHIILIRTSKHNLEFLVDCEIVSETANESMYSRIKFKQPERKDLGNFFALYEKYLNALSCNLVFAKCASKLTRVDKLYSKELVFTTTNKTSGKDKVSSKIKKFLFDTRKFEAYEKNKSIYVDLQNILYSSEKDLPKSEIEMLNNKLAAINISIKKFEESTSPSDIYQAKKERQIEWDRLDQERQKSVFTKNKDLQHKLTDIININLEEGKVPKPLILSGEAGMGKTITTHQIALNYVSDLQHRVERYQTSNMLNLNLPIFFKAKKMIFQEYDDAIIDDTTAIPKGPVGETWVRNVVSSQFATFPDLGEYISYQEMCQLIVMWSGLSDLHNGNVTYFIDGLDELPNRKSAEAIIRNCLDEKVSKQKQPFLFCSTRPSFYSAVKETMGSDGHNITKLIPKETFSEEELSHDMPNMLCDAWGLNRESAEELRRNLDKYREIIEHPLFVGWICFLIYEGKLNQIKLTSQNKEVVTNEILDQIINIGIRSSLDRRETNVSDIASFEQKVREFVALSIHYSIDKPIEVFAKMKHLGISVDFGTRNAIKSDCGILFLTGNKIEWTHKRLAEVIYADYMINSKHLLLGPLRVSSPVLARIAQKELKIGRFNDFDSALIHNWHKYFPRDEFEDKIKTTYLSFYPNGEAPLIGYGKFIGVRRESDLVANPLGNCTPAQAAIAELYIENLGTNNAFRLDNHEICRYSSDGNYAGNEILELLYQQSWDLFGEDILKISYDPREDLDSSLSVQGNIVPVDQLDMSRVSGEIEINRIWQYVYHEVLIRGQEPDHVFDRIFHSDYSRKINMKSKNMFDIDWHGQLDLDSIFERETAQVDYFYESEDFSSDPSKYTHWDSSLQPLLWFPAGLNFKFAKILDEKKIEKINLLRHKVVDNATKQLFGHDKEECLNILWQELSEERTFIDENSKIQCNLLSALLFEDSIWYDYEETEDNQIQIKDITKVVSYKMGDNKAVMLFPFINECIKIIDKGDNPYNKTYKFECEYISGLFIGETYVRAFELIKDYYPNLASEG